VRRAAWKHAASSRIAELSARYELPDGASDRLLTLLELLVSDPFAPTSVRDPSRALEDHLADSLVALELREMRGASTIADLGAGAGLPGLPLAIALPGAQVALVESSSRKCRFIERVIDACGTTNARAVHARMESWTDGLRSFELVTARALASLEVVAEYAAPLLRVGGTAVVWRGRRDQDTEAAAAAAAAKLGLELREPRAVRPYPAAAHRHLHLMLKVRETPEGFPRRPGMARKRPLGRNDSPSDR
jgi:16S rRNA (guanine527-N7)-methyltransferase